MSSTRSPFPAAQATEVVIVSHGSPSDPEPQEVFVKDLAKQVADHSGLAVRGATLAAEGALAAALDGFKAPLIFPHFMADGWFVSTNLPKRLTAAGQDEFTVLPPLGLSPRLPTLAIDGLVAALKDQKLDGTTTTLVVAAHGSPSDPRPARATEAFAGQMRASGLFAGVSVGYVDEEPSLESALSGHDDAIVLPFFAAKAGHVLMDLPEAVAEAAFTGPVLEPVGTWAGIPELIAQSLASPPMRKSA